ncbi:hypothetical protein SCP_1501270 [Sparassis crispa]|uniref:USP domain-containing protein n=1 Tax=Sparassis crispa TaxID=139825 RepID=A0A401H3Y1_9APHY|nr:hypothetical protein SCP_1501270 [Sparassis crispa]GBE89124.1 hypothetical protein SCP_1501270 [Sparassis crispa]
MLKHKKNQPTAQELYRARKQREEQEREAYLPPGLINHGNTCFMNSTLQGLLATKLLHNLVNFEPVPSAAGPSVLAHRSPQLTNGHGSGGEYERSWEEGMPLGDVFVNVMQKAWSLQEGRKRESMSPKEILTGIGRKYDQYLDFRQQDAHEFLRHMLDAMRMEELDIIKKRQPPPTKDKATRSHKKRHVRSLPSATKVVLPEQTSHSDPSIASPIASPAAASVSAPAEEDKLTSFVDLIFGGRLASILVCEKCKKISVTYEDFNDISLSIKPEDYVKDRRRDRLKKLAKKLRFFPQPGSGSTSDLDDGGQRRRSSSVPPPSPLRKSMEAIAHVHEEPPIHDGPRRVSFDHAGPAAEDARDAVRDMAGDKVEATAEAAEKKEDANWEVTDAVDATENALRDKADGEQGKEKKEKEDPWGKLGRRISMRVSRRMRELGSPSHSVERGRRTGSNDAVRFLAKKDKSARSSLAPTPVNERDTDNDTSDAPVRHSAPLSPVLTPLSSPHTGTATLAQTAPIKRTHSDAPFTPRRSRSPVPPKLSNGETAYLRRILADVNTLSTNPNPFSMLQQALTSTHYGVGPSSSASAAHALWVRMGHLPGVVECLRMFTAVEVLDGENMVGCHRCWKIANGCYKLAHRDELVGEDADSESEESEASEGKLEGNIMAPNITQRVRSLDADEGRLLSSPDMSTGGVSPASTSAISMSVTSDSEYVNDTKSVSTAPSTVDITLLPNGDVFLSPEASSLATYSGIPIPSISTTAPELPPSTSQMAVATQLSEADQSRPPSSLDAPTSTDTLLTPKRHPRSQRKDAASGESDSLDDSDDSGSLSDTSANTSAFSDVSPAASPLASPTVSPRASVENLQSSASPSAVRLKTLDGTSSPQVPRSKQVIPRRMYKRYLIATPPPVLVVHLKRFQQVSKLHAMSFSGGFKKLDHFVAFPEELDLGPFVAPKKEDFVLKGKGTRRTPNGVIKGTERCMYRLYAVVVHIGNMLGGHYIAYTALSSPNAAPPPPTPPADSNSPTLSTTAPTKPIGSEYQVKSTKSPRQWAYISDTVVRLTTLEEVLKAKAYICMYERI